MQDFIRIRGVRVHNLKDISLSIPHNQMTVITGVSGSGKSSLAFDTIYAEGQRRYVESLSAYARQFLERMEKPDVDEIDGIAPAVAIRQKNSTRNPRSTVATSTECYDFLPLLYARLAIGPGLHQRVVDTIEICYREAGEVIFENAAGGGQLRFNERFQCKACGKEFNQPEPILFSFNSPFGACPRCQGFGNTIDFDMDLVIPDKTKTLAEGAIEPWTKPKYRPLNTELKRFAKQVEIPLDAPWAALDPEHQRMIIGGEGRFPGVRGFFNHLERKKYKLHVRVFLSRYRGYSLCSTCGGARLRAEARQVKINGHNICEVCSLTVEQASQFFSEVTLTTQEAGIAEKLLEEIEERLKFLNEVGLEYLTLNRLSSTLSGGEAQRLQLATSRGSRLVGTLYVLDEPSIGLHSRDTHRLIK